MLDMAQQPEGESEMASTTKPRAYHRGNVREDLIEAALEMLKTEGISGLSLNKMAKSLGVSAPAVYNHFRNKEALLAAVAARGFHKLTAAKEAVLAETAPGKRRRALSLAYLKFACDEPNLYRLMFRHEISNRHDYPELIAAENESYGLTVQLGNQSYDPTRAAQKYPRAFLMWSTLHGMATLIADKQIRVRTRKDLEYLADIIADGLKSRD